MRGFCGKGIAPRHVDSASPGMGPALADRHKGEVLQEVQSPTSSASLGVAILQTAVCAGHRPRRRLLPALGPQPMRPQARQLVRALGPQAMLLRLGRKATESGELQGLRVRAACKEHCLLDCASHEAYQVESHRPQVRQS